MAHILYPAFSIQRGPSSPGLGLSIKWGLSGIAGIDDHLGIVISVKEQYDAGKAAQFRLHRHLLGYDNLVRSPRQNMINVSRVKGNQVFSIRLGQSWNVCCQNIRVYLVGYVLRRFGIDGLFIPRLRSPSSQFLALGPVGALQLRVLLQIVHGSHDRYPWQQLF